MSDTRVRKAERAHHGRGSNARELLLLDKIRLGDGTAFEALYRLYHPRLTNFLIKLIRQPQLVEEVLKDTMMVVWQRPDSFQAPRRRSARRPRAGRRQARGGVRARVQERRTRGRRRRFRARLARSWWTKPRAISEAGAGTTLRSIHQPSCGPMPEA